MGLHQCKCDHMIEARGPDIVAVNQVKKEATIIDFAIPEGTRACDKEREKIKKYSLLKFLCDSCCSWNIRNYIEKYI